MKNKILLITIIFSAILLSSCKPSNDYSNPSVTYTISWTTPIATKGSYIKTMSPSAGTDIKNSSKQILYTDTSGKQCSVSPYEAKEIQILGGTSVIFQMYGIGNSNQNSEVQVILPDGTTKVKDTGSYGKLLEASITPSSNLLITASDNKSNNDAGSLVSCDWKITLTNN